MTEANRNKLNALLLRIEKRIMEMYGAAYVKALKIPEIRNAVNAGEEDFDWKRHPGASKKVGKMLDTLSKELNALVSSSVSLAYDEGASDADTQVVSLLGKTKVGRKFAEEVCGQAQNQRREEGLTGWNYIQGKRGGLSLSDRVWESTKRAKDELRVMIQGGVIEGKSADEISRDVRGCLRDPHRLFRRVRDKKTGVLRLSKAAAAYHPGRGVYRSSYKNAVRTARTEVNQGYRVGEQQAYEKNPLVKGYDIMLSNNHTTTDGKGGRVSLHDICDELAGRYPKDFVWSGWHPQCRCRMVPVPLSAGEFGEYMKKKKAGRLDEWDDPSKKVGMPEAFSKWVEKNREKIVEADKDGRLPYFLRDNGGLWRGIAVGGSSTAGGQAAGTAAQPKGTPPAARHQHYDAIEAAKNAKEVADVLTQAGVVFASVGLEKMRLEDVKSVAHAMAEVSERFKLDAIELNAVYFGAKEKHTFAHAHGRLLEFNTSFFDKKNAAKLDKSYKHNVEDFVKDVNEWIKYCEDCKIKYPYNAAQYDKSIAEYKRKLAFSRHNVILSRETAARDVAIHEYGHTVHAQICGALNGQRFLRKNIDIKEADRLRKKSEDLFKKYEKSSDFQWLSKYGMTDFKEFFAESFVLYMCKPESLPADVRQMFEEVERFANM